MEINWLTPPDELTLSGDGVHVWAVPLDDSRFSWQELESPLSADELERAQRFARHDLRRRFVVAHAATRSILGCYLAARAADVPIVSDSHGKPRLAGSSVAADLRFNLAHSGELALVAVTRGSEIGIDVEQLRPVKHLLDLVERYFAPSEAAAILSANGPRRDAEFLATWTAKEAVLKALGRGLGHPLDKVCVSPTDARQWVTANEPSTGPNAWWLQRLESIPGYTAAVATGQLRRSPTTFRFDGAKVNHFHS